MRTCVYCDKPLPKPARTGGRRKEFCNDACKNRHYRQYKQIKRDADMTADPFWHEMYKRLLASYTQLGAQAKERIQMLGERQRDIDDLESLARYWQGKYEDLRMDYATRMKALGISKEAIKEFNDYWLEQGSSPLYVERLHESDDKKEIQDLKQELEREVNRHKNAEAGYRKWIATLEAQIKGLTAGARHSK